MAGVGEVVEDARIITQTGDRDAAGTGETSRPNDADARARTTPPGYLHVQLQCHVLYMWLGSLRYAAFDVVEVLK